MEEMTDFVIPGHVFQLMATKRIKVLDLLICYLVSIHQSQDSGCDLSHEQMAEWLGGTVDTLETHLEDLLELGLLFEVTVNNRTYLEVEWARISIERHGMTGDYGRAIRKAYNNLVERLNSKAKAKR